MLFGSKQKKLVKLLARQGIENKDVLVAIEKIPRHMFVDESQQKYAYENEPLSIGFGQTISQPYIVARMTEAILESATVNRVLEIGTGSGYQAAILSQLVAEVYSVERIEALLQHANQVFTQLQLTNIHTHYGDGNLGWEEHAPYDAIIVTANSETVPQALLEQLADAGRLIIPIGESLYDQQLQLITRHGDSYTTEPLESVVFVPLLPGTE